MQPSAHVAQSGLVRFENLERRCFHSLSGLPDPELFTLIGVFSFFVGSQNFPCCNLQPLLSMLPHHPSQGALPSPKLLIREQGQQISSPCVACLIDLFAIVCANSVHEYISCIFQVQLHKFLRDRITAFLGLLVVALSNNKSFSKSFFLSTFLLA